MKKIVLILVSLTVTLHIHARGILVTPTQINLSAAAGQSAGATIRVSSSKAEANQVKASIADFVRDENGRMVMIQSNPRSCARWIDIDRVNFETPIDGSVELRATVHLPKDAVGSYWALVRLESVPPARKENHGVTMQIVPSIAVPLYVTVAGTEKAAVVVVETQAFQRADREVIDSWAVIENTGNTVVPLSGAFALEHPTNDGGEEFASGNFIPTILLPGAKARVQVQMPWKGSSAGLQMHAYLRYGNGVEDATEAVIAITDEFKGERPANPVERLFPKEEPKQPASPAATPAAEEKAKSGKPKKK